MIDPNLLNDLFMRDDAGALMHLSVHEVDINGRSMLHHACHFGAHECVRLLLAAGASVDHQDNMGETPVHRACYAGHTGILTDLLRQRPNLNLKTFFGATALHYAARRHPNAPTLLRDLIEAGASVDVKDNRDLTPKDWADQHQTPWPVMH